jgi:hypothetical protein
MSSYFAALLPQICGVGSVLPGVSPIYQFRIAFTVVLGGGSEFSSV